MHTKLPNISFFQKLVIFCCLIFEEFERVCKSGILWPIAWEGVIKWFIRFFKIVPLKAPHFLFKWFHNERKCLLRQVHYQQQSPILSGFPLFKIRRYFQSYFLILFCTGFILFLDAVNKIHDDKRHPKSLFISCKCWHRSNVYISQKAHSQMKTFITKLPLVDLLS